MPLSPKEEIIQADIYKLLELKDSKVYVLCGPSSTPQQKLVLKIEASLNLRSDQVKSASSIMGAIDPKIKATIITDKERATIRQWCADAQHLAAAYKELGAKVSEDEQKAAHNLDTALAENSVAYKLPLLAVTNIEDAIKKKQGEKGDKSEVRTFIETLKAAGGLEKLGQVIAADLFNGNDDRFWPYCVPQKKTIGQQSFQFDVLVNAGNVFVVAKDSGFEVNALDYVAPTSAYKDINMPLRESESDDLEGKGWPFRLLTDKKKREHFAGQVASDLENLLNPNRPKLSPFTKLGRDAGSRIATGMIQGAKAIKAKLEKKYRAPMPAGVKDRYDIAVLVK